MGAWPTGMTAISFMACVSIAVAPGAVDVVDTVSLQKIKSINNAGPVHNTYVTPDGKYAVMGSTRTSVFTVVDLQKEEVAWEINLGKGVRPMTIEANPDGSTKRVFAQVSELDGFMVIDFAARKQVATIQVPKVADAPEVIAHRLDSPSHGIGVSPDNRTLWVTSILMSAVPNWVTFTPDGKEIYISNAAHNSVSAIDTQAMKEIAVIPVGQAPKRIGTLVARGG